MPQQRVPITTVPWRPDRNTGNSVPYSLRIVCGFFNFPQLFYNKGCETGPPAYSPYPRRLESLTICWCNYKGSTFSSVILRPWVLVRPESNSQLTFSTLRVQELKERQVLWHEAKLAAQNKIIKFWGKSQVPRSRRMKSIDSKLNTIN